MRRTAAHSAAIMHYSAQYRVVRCLVLGLEQEILAADDQSLHHFWVYANRHDNPRHKVAYKPVTASPVSCRPASNSLRTLSRSFSVLGEACTIHSLTQKGGRSSFARTTSCRPYRSTGSAALSSVHRGTAAARPCAWARTPTAGGLALSA